MKNTYKAAVVNFILGYDYNEKIRNLSRELRILNNFIDDQKMKISNLTRSEKSLREMVAFSDNEIGKMKGTIKKLKTDKAGLEEEVRELILKLTDARLETEKLRKINHEMAGNHRRRK